MTRKLVTIASFASLLACALLIALWIRNIWFADIIAWSNGTSMHSVNAEKGVFRFLLQRNAGMPRQLWHVMYRSPGRGMGLWAELRSLGHVLAPLGVDYRTEFPNAPPGAQYFAVYLPHWLFILLTGAPAGLWLQRERRAARVRRRIQLGQCVGCGYDLRATSDRCPECGATPSLLIAEGKP